VAAHGAAGARGLNMSAGASPGDTRLLRHALGCFGTGVTIVTCEGPGGQLFGVTANSFSSVSLDPPLVLWSIANRSASRDAFVTASHFAVHVLRAGQISLSNQFARPGDKYAGVAYSRNEHAVPVLSEYVARFECASHRVYEGGDHTILLGRVERFDFNDAEPLLFVQGEYAAASLHPDRIRDLRTGRSYFAPADIEYWL
jgi:flavin reductase (DIM6/NTAB) family NADH-FMN oxidoreductase RutF